MTAFRFFIVAVLLSLLMVTPQSLTYTAIAQVANDAPRLPLTTQPDPEKLSASLRAILAQLGQQPAAKVGIIVRFVGQVDLDRTLSKAKSSSRIDRAIALTDVLQQTADADQHNVMAYLTRPDIAAQSSDIHQLWIINGLALNATAEVISVLMARPEVASITIDEWNTWIESQEPRIESREPKTKNTEDEAQELSDQSSILNLQSLIPNPQSAIRNLPSPISVALSAIAFVEPPAKGEVVWGVGAVGADRVWKGLGVTGKGIVVGNIDTGVDWNHPALKTRYRGYDERGLSPVNHLHSWFDPTNEAAFYPSDVNGHGTHTMGTMVGINGIGVAPGAKWIAAKGFNSAGQAPNSWLHRALQFMLAPGGKPEYAPDVVNNSWGNNNPSVDEFEPDVQVLNAAGIFTLWASGNSGPRSGSVSSPASRPGAYAVGASDNENEVANFSGRGPAPDESLKPHLIAPGVRIASAFPGGNYLLSTGTSQATPHVAGVAALLLSVQPSFDITQTMFVLTSTALPVGNPIPNNDAGWGRVDAYAALLSQVQTGVITGTVLDNGQPISGALVTALGDVYQAYDTTDADGNFMIKVRAGNYLLKANAYGYFEGYSNQRSVATGQTVVVNVALQRMPSGVLRGVVTDARTGEQLPATVRAIGTPRNSVSQQNCFPCRYYLDLPAAEYVIEARLTGYGVQTRTISIADGVAVDVDFALKAIQKIVFVDSGAWYLASAMQYYTETLNSLGYAYDVMRIKQIPRDLITTSQLLKYDTIIWSSPNDAPSFTNGDDVISETLMLGKNLLLTGQDIAYHDGGGKNFRPYFEKINAWFVDDNSTNFRVEGVTQTLLAGRVFTITGGDGAQNQEGPDIIRVRNVDNGHLIAEYAPVSLKASTMLTPAGALPSRGAGIYTSQCLSYSVAFLPFGMEGISTLAHRTDVMGQILNAFVQPRPKMGLELTPLNPLPTGAAIGLPGEVVSHSFRVRHTGEAGLPETFSIAFDGNKWQAAATSVNGQRDVHEITLAPCSSTVITLSVTIPQNLPRNSSDVLNVTVSPRNWSPNLKRTLRFPSKTPAAALLVDDDRFYDREKDYLDALASVGTSVDRWDTRTSLGSQFTQAPSLNDLNRYPMVVWFNAYDWFDPITSGERKAMRQYLEAGGRLFFSSQAALHYSSGEQRQATDFDRNMLGVAYVDFNSSTNQIVSVPGSVLGDDILSGTLLPFPYGFNLSAAVQPMQDTQVIIRGDNGQPYGLARASHVSNEEFPALSNESRLVFFPFAYEVLNKPLKAELMNRIVGWLSPLGESRFSAAPNNIPVGGQFVYSLTLKADELLNHLGAYTSTKVAISVTLPSQIKVLTHTLPPGSLGNGWRGTLTQGEAQQWQIVAQHTGVANDSATTEILTAQLHITLPEMGIHFSKPLLVRVNAPKLLPSMSIAPQLLQWRESATVTIGLRNVSGVDVEQVSLRNAVPARLNVIESSLKLSPSDVGELVLLGNRLDWTGALTAGHAITISYQISLPRFGFNNPLAFFNQVIVTDDARAATHAETWMLPETMRVSFPIIWNNQFSETIALTETISTMIEITPVVR